MKSLAEFKRRLKVGLKIHGVHHLGFTGLRGNDGKPIYEDIDNGVREVSIVQANAFALKTRKVKEDGSEKWSDSWCHHGKASEYEFTGNDTVTLTETDREGNKYKVLTYTIIE